MRCLVLAIFAPLILASQAQGQARANAHTVEGALTYYDKIQIATSSEVENIKKLNERVKAGDRSLCVGYHGTDMSGCAKYMILRMPAHSAEGLREMLNIPVTAAIRDREQGFGDRRSGFLLVDSFLTVVESIKPQKFFARTVRARTAKDRDARKLVREKQNALLESFRQQALPEADQHLAKSEMFSANADAQAAAWESKTLPQLQTRLAKLRTRRWSVQ